jgi:hypothetical protein
MIKAKQAVAIVFAIILFPLSPCSFAQVADLSGCRAIEDRLERFDCYEALGEDPVSNQQGPATETSPAAPASTSSTPAVVQPVERGRPAPVANSEAVPNQDIDKFGTVAATDDSRLIEGKSGKTELIDTVASVEHRLPTLALVTLKNGQRWLQTINKPYPLKAGDEVRIYPSSYGKAYRLTAPRISGFIQVERLQ